MPQTTGEPTQPPERSDSATGHRTTPDNDRPSWRVANRNSPAASSRTSRSASRRSVLTRSPDARGTFPTATTRTSIRRSTATRARPNPVGPAS
jgi:hypothetical protein